MRELSFTCHSFSNLEIDSSIFWKEVEMEFRSVSSVALRMRSTICRRRRINLNVEKRGFETGISYPSSSMESERPSRKEIQLL